MKNTFTRKFFVTLVIASIIFLSVVVAYLAIQESPDELGDSEEAEQKAIPIRGVAIKGVSTTGELFINHEVWLRAKFVEEAKKMGVNWVQLVIWVLVTDNGELIESARAIYDPSAFSSMDDLLKESQMTEEVIVSLVQYLHQEGFKIFLTTYHERLGAHHEYGYGLKIDVDTFLDQAAEIAVKWARIAEENDVEMFAPRKELQLFVGDEKALQWDDDILPELRKVYNGSLVRGAFEIYDWVEVRHGVTQADVLPSNMSGWDYLGVDFYGSEANTFEDLESMFARFVQKTQELKTEFDLKGVVFVELGIPHAETEAYWSNKSISANEVLRRIYQIYFEEGAGKIDGFFPWIWHEGIVVLPCERSEYIKPNEVIASYYNASEIPRYEAALAEEFICNPINYSVTSTLIPIDSWSSWMLSIEGDPSERGVHVVSPGFLEIKGIGVEPTEDLQSEKWDNYLLRGRFKIFEGLFLIHFRCSSASTYTFHIHPISTVHLSKTTNEGWYMLYDRNVLVEYAKWYNFTILVKNDVLQVSIDGQVLVYCDPDPLLEGFVRIDCGKTDAHILFDDLVVEKIE